MGWLRQIAMSVGAGVDHLETEMLFEGVEVAVAMGAHLDKELETGFDDGALGGFAGVLHGLVDEGVADFDGGAHGRLLLFRSA